MAYNAVAEFQTRAAVRLLPIVACHYFDDWCCAEPDFSCHSAQKSLEEFMRLTGLDLDGVIGCNNQLIPAKKADACAHPQVPRCHDKFQALSLLRNCAHVCA